MINNIVTHLSPESYLRGSKGIKFPDFRILLWEYIFVIYCDKYEYKNCYNEYKIRSRYLH